MGEPAPTAVTYEGLPIGGGGAHTLRMGRRSAYDATMGFLNDCAVPTRPPEISLRLRPVPDLATDADLRRRLAAAFGTGDVIILADDEVADALDLLEEIDPRPRANGMPALQLQVRSRFLLRDPATGDALPGQTDDLFHRVGFANDLALLLDDDVRLRLELCIPGADDAVLARVLPDLVRHLPCRLSPKHWRAWRPTRSRTLRGRVLDVSSHLAPVRI